MICVTENFPHVLHSNLNEGKFSTCGRGVQQFDFMQIFYMWCTTLCVNENLPDVVHNNLLDNQCNG
jgi:hypothetical protein